MSVDKRNQEEQVDNTATFCLNKSKLLDINKIDLNQHTQPDDVKSEQKVIENKVQPK